MITIVLNAKALVLSNHLLTKFTLLESRYLLVQIRNLLLLKQVTINTSLRMN